MAQKKGRGFDDFDARMRRLRSDAGLDEAERESRRPIGGMGMQVGVEMVAGVIGGSLIGYGLDAWFGTSPVLFIVFFFLGAAAGLLNAYRYIQRLAQDDGSGRDQKR